MCRAAQIIKAAQLGTRSHGPLRVGPRSLERNRQLDPLRWGPHYVARRGRPLRFFERGTSVWRAAQLGPRLMVRKVVPPWCQEAQIIDGRSMGVLRNGRAGVNLR